MRRDLDRRLARFLSLSWVILLILPRFAHGDALVPRARASVWSGGPENPAEIANSTRTDHDRQPIPRPPEWEPSYWGGQFHQGFTEPLSHVFDVPDKLLWVARAFGVPTQREAVNADAFDEAPNSSWFTNRNHLRAISVAELRQGPDAVFLPAKPWTIKHAKVGGWSAGFQIKDADGKKWMVKLDPRDHAQLSSGADMVSRTLLHAAGYNVPHNEPVRFTRADLTIDATLLSGADGQRFTEVDLDSVLARGAVFAGGGYSASASLFVSGKVLGAPSMDRLRPGDSNDWYAHKNRRELRGLFVLCSWINDWDTKDSQFLDTFIETRDSLGHVEHYILDVGSSFGAAAIGPKDLWASYENMVDFAWIARRFASLGFANEPWRRARQDTGIPSVGNYESDVYRPEDFRQMVPHPVFREMTDRDGYWGAKIVASFSDAQIAAAVDAARYEDPRAGECLVRNLIMRRDKIARHWFARVAPLDFFTVSNGALHFHDLATDLGMTGSRGYDVVVESARGATHLSLAELPLGDLGHGASHLWLSISISGDRAKPARVELSRKGSVWSVGRVRHG